MIAAALANGKQLTRVIVLKPLLKQTTDLLGQRLGGYVGRRIYYTPLSRSTFLDHYAINVLDKIYNEALQGGGVLLMLPDHMLSFRLLGRERLSVNRELGTHLIELDRWLQGNCRNLMDESDEILDTRFQLIYTTGSQVPMDGGSDRWEIVQDVLDRVASHAVKLSKTPGKIEIEYLERGAFPTLRFLDPTVGEALLDLLVEDLDQGLIPDLSLDSLTVATRKLALSFVKEINVDESSLQLLQNRLKRASFHRLRLGLYLIRGLIAHKILLYCLEKKRWLVEYGLSAERCMLAVPFKVGKAPNH